jgi:hypothetical protein
MLTNTIIGAIFLQYNVEFPTCVFSLFCRCVAEIIN